ncbi:hypothetical protein [Herbidospora mongoliensis]|uniref:hypothetical protein n=1 Tax=Herbidospora mongoliensis TaxID=688067 RepID=UPI000836DF78|nr:hypothetical protein [Herbidospora mongoliensis]
MTTDLAQPDIFVRHVPGRRRSFMVGVAVFLALCLTVAVLKIVERQVFGPEETVRSFFAGLAGRDPVAAAAFVVESTTADDGMAAMVGKAYTPPESVRVVDAVIDENRATVAAAYTIRGSEQEILLTLVRNEQATAGLFHGWLITGGAVSQLDVDAGAVDSVTVGGSTVPGRRALVFGAYPGGYEVTLPVHPIWRLDPVTVFAGAGGLPSTATLSPQVQEAAWTAVGKQLRGHLDACAKSAEAAPAGCPFAYSTGYYSLNDLDWRIVKYPLYNVVQDETGSVVVQTIEEGEVAISGTRSYGFYDTAQPFTESVTFSQSGQVIADGKEIVFIPVA